MKKLECLSEFDPLDSGGGHLYHEIGKNEMVLGTLREIGGEGQYAGHNSKCFKCGEKASLHKIVFHREFHPRQYYISKSGAY